jgi:hypothetical protein
VIQHEPGRASFSGHTLLSEDDVARYASQLAGQLCAGPAQPIALLVQRGPRESRVLRRDGT